MSFPRTSISLHWANNGCPGSSYDYNSVKTSSHRHVMLPYRESQVVTHLKSVVSYVVSKSGAEKDAPSFDKSTSYTDKEELLGMLKRAVWLEKCGLYQEGITEIEAYLSQHNEIKNDGQDAAKLQLTLANMYVKSGKYRKGVKLLETLSGVAPDDPTVWQVWAVHEWKQGKYKSAKSKFEHGMTLGNSPHSPLLVAYASMEAQRRNRTKARSLLRQAVTGGQNNPHAWVSWAQLEGRMGNFRKAINLCKEGLRLHADNVYLLCTLGQIYESSGDSKMAQKVWEDALRISPSNNFAVHELGKLAWKNGDIEEASRYFEQGVESPDPRGALLCTESLANVYAFQGQDQEARKLFTRMHKRFEVTSSRFLRAWALFEKKTGNVVKASELYSESAQINPRDERTWLQWALLEKRRNNFEKALDCVRAGVQVSPVNPFLWQLYGSLVWEHGSPEEGRAIFSRAMQACPRNQQILMEWAIMEIRQGDQKKGLDVLRRADTSSSSKHIPILQLWSATAISLGFQEEGEKIAAFVTMDDSLL